MSKPNYRSQLLQSQLFDLPEEIITIEANEEMEIQIQSQGDALEEYL